jgi:glycosyltransferase involved in cell wall biosynthesis
MKQPKISVIMPVYNASAYLREALESILKQTFVDFEFIIVDDGSKDDSRSIIASYTDPRIRYVEHKKNMGLIATLNEMLELAQAPYVARMDSDDVSLPTRLEKEYAYLEQNPDVVAVGSEATVISIDGRPLYEQVALAEHEAIVRILAVASPFVHGSVLLRRDAVLLAGSYSKEAYQAEDYELWYRLSKVGKLANLKETLYQYRYNPAGETLSKSAKQKQAMQRMSDIIWETFPKSDPAPLSIWPTIWDKKLLSQAPIADNRRQLAHFHIYFARGYFRHNQWTTGVRHLIAAWKIAPTVWPFYFYYLTLPILPERIGVSLEARLIALFAKLKRW